ncbi:uncharacterized protein BDR25DRAFT_360258 [Lindgomyces ingoldianus]|uniref:Uncharacterized protein n=1 Tax=Lindgomyces ingoldianus TaxID=673940 RepID=A0ACB6QFH3_9PLEO|nr:uncharacterized protein BDR25DRAFT_360258 [Lindgomyces ingoldianus]KAF2465739.1 hypothetical protein BDR25DRAFT_360258 [Lindgomyces ingoldianus]
MKFRWLDLREAKCEVIERSKDAGCCGELQSVYRPFTMHMHAGRSANPTTLVKPLFLPLALLFEGYAARRQYELPLYHYHPVQVLCRTMRERRKQHKRFATLCALGFLGAFDSSKNPSIRLAEDCFEYEDDSCEITSTSIEGREERHYVDQWRRGKVVPNTAEAGRPSEQLHLTSLTSYLLSHTIRVILKVKTSIAKLRRYSMKDFPSLTVHPMSLQRQLFTGQKNICKPKGSMPSCPANHRFGVLSYYIHHFAPQTLNPQYIISLINHAHSRLTISSPKRIPNNFHLIFTPPRGVFLLHSKGA